MFSPKFLLAVGLSIAMGSVLLADEPTAADREFFRTTIRPLLKESCIGCHGGEKTEASLDLTSRDGALEGGNSGPAVVPKEPSKSLLVKAVEYQGRLQMPPKAKLTEREIEALRSWIERGAPWDRE